MVNELKNKVLSLVENDARLTKEKIAVMLDKSVDEIAQAIEELENEGVILGYKALVDWDKTDREYVSAIIELRITPQRDRGFDKVAEMIYTFPEVKSLYLMSGAYDLHVVLEGKTMREVACFVSEKLALIDAVLSTSTHFVLKKYKDKGVIYDNEETDERGSCLV